MHVVVDDEGGLAEEEEITIETAGSALATMASEPEIDWCRCSSNDILDVYNTLGIEAARAIIFHELRTLVAGDSGKVNDRHIIMVSTTMTFYGIVMPMSRHGINRIADTGPLLRCSFEETSEVLTDAGVYGEAEHHMRGISQSIMMGKTPYIGTGCCDALQLKDSKPDEAHGQGFEVTGPTITKKALSESRFRGNKSHCVVSPPQSNPMTQRGNSSPTGGLGYNRPDEEEEEEGAHLQPPPYNTLGPTEIRAGSHPISQGSDGICLETELRDIFMRMPFEPPRSPRIGDESIVVI
jgi:DNA-directed RNA polymerase II subunit RPB1